MEKLRHMNVVTSCDMGEFHDLGKLEKAMNAIIKRRNSLIYFNTAVYTNIF